jgi:peptidoglycan/LPS O-acetylase OafA/YrhL
MACALAGTLITTLPLSDYLSDGAVRYLIANLAFLNFLGPDLPGVFQGNAVHAVNGALWTLKIEVMFYVSVPIIAAACARLGRLPVLAAIYVLSIGYLVVLEQLAQHTGRGIFVLLARQLPGQLAYFVVGAACYYHLEVLRRQWLQLVAVALVILLAPLPRWLYTALAPAALGIFVVYLAIGARYVGNFGRYGDLSYGVYIIHFPVLQMLIALGVFQGNPYLAVALAAMLVLGAAFVSWHLVEKPFLKKSSHYVVATAATKIA